MILGRRINRSNRANEMKRRKYNLKSLSLKGGNVNLGKKIFNNDLYLLSLQRKNLEKGIAPFDARLLFTRKLSRSRPRRDATVRKSAAKEADNINPRPRVNTEKAIVKKEKKTELPRYSTGELGRIFDRKKFCARLMSVTRHPGVRVPSACQKSH